MNQGFIKISRELNDWEWSTDEIMVYFLVKYILRANWEDQSWRGRTVKRGQFIATLNELSGYLNKSVQNIRSTNEKLEKCGELQITSTNQFTVYTVVKYDKFQDVPTVSNKPTNKPTTNQPTNDIYIDVKEVKEVKEKKTITNVISKENPLVENLFKDFWSIYPRRDDRLKAEQSFTRIFNDEKNDESIRQLYGSIRTGLEAYCKNIHARQLERKYIKLPTTWLNGQNWTDEFAEIMHTAPKAAQNNGQRHERVDSTMAGIRKSAEAIRRQSSERDGRRMDASRQDFSD